ncbi:HNH endonuclease [Acuticoccus sp. M5D2P5]|uniref:HNH endonuclease n=1 Tax=Acuticoccus kalidii TaxID=2910977 RepID=UPI001F436911|nr:HNH endonuclease [Acuticoccus kalidii]MCF3933289.1 HNH endonuclease [Acuticoccus kalidii]
MTDRTAKHRRDRTHDAHRREAKPWRRWYKRAAWLRLRALQLSEVPLCERHAAAGDVVLATVVNHRVPHRGDWALFTDRANHESLCESCHNAVAQAEEARGYSVAVDATGWPIDPRHPAN